MNRFFLIILFLSALLGNGLCAKEIKVLTYNVLADSKDAKTRIPVLLNILKESDADIIALQEVAPWFYLKLATQPWAKNYHFPTLASGVPIAPSGLLIISKTPISDIDYGKVGGIQGRSYLTIETKLNGKSFIFANCHLESFLESGDVRAMQMEIILKRLKKHQHAIFLGDFNFGDGEKEEKTIPKTFRDSWLVTNPKEKGFTWDREISPMAKAGSFPNEKSRRLDRILVKSDILKTTKSMILGQKPIPGHPHIFPSDHFGLLSIFKQSPDKKHPNSITP